MNDFVDQNRVLNIAIAIILAISAFIIPAAIIFPAKSSFITTQAQEIGTSQLALLTGGIGILALAFIFVVFGVVENKLKKLILSLIIGVIAFIGISLSIKDYYYLTPDYFALNEPFAYVTQIYEWDDFESVEEVLTKADGTTAVGQVVLRMKDGKRFTYEGGAMLRMYSTIITKVEDAGGEHIRTKP